MKLLLAVCMLTVGVGCTGQPNVGQYVGQASIEITVMDNCNGYISTQHGSYYYDVNSSISLDTKLCTALKQQISDDRIRVQVKTEVERLLQLPITVWEEPIR